MLASKKDSELIYNQNSDTTKIWNAVYNCVDHGIISSVIVASTQNCPIPAIIVQLEFRWLVLTT